jgi:hypothetical protein
MPVRLKKLIGTVIIVRFGGDLRACRHDNCHLPAWPNPPGMCIFCTFLFTGVLWVVPAMFVIRWMERPPKTARIAPAPEAITEQWSALEADPQTSFHQSRAWVEAWTKTTGANLNVVSLEHNGVPFAILPLEIEQRGGLSIARFAGTAHSNENTGLIDTKQLAKIGPFSAKQLATALTKAGLLTDIVLFDKMTQKTAGQPPFSGLPRVLHQNPSFQLPLFSGLSKSRAGADQRQAPAQEVPAVRSGVSKPLADTAISPATTMTISRCGC